MIINEGFLAIRSSSHYIPGTLKQNVFFGLSLTLAVLAVAVTTIAIAIFISHVNPCLTMGMIYGGAIGFIRAGHLPSSEKMWYIVACIFIGATLGNTINHVFGDLKLVGSFV